MSDFSKENSVLIVKSENPNDNLLVVFGGLAMGLPFPVFEFFKSLKNVEATKVFVRDTHQCWYTKGLSNFSSSIETTGAYLQNLIDESQAKKTMFIGNSAGGFAAMLFGNMLQVDEVHAFSPQTFLKPNLRLRHRDFRWKKESLNIRINRKVWKYLDLKAYLGDSHNLKTKFYTYYDKTYRLDNIHGARMTFSNIIHHQYEGGGHLLIRDLKEKGELNQIIAGFFKKESTKQ